MLLYMLCFLLMIFSKVVNGMLTCLCQQAIHPPNANTKRWWSQDPPHLHQPLQFHGTPSRSRMLWKVKETRLDTHSNIHDMAYDFQFIRSITTFPDLSVILYHPDIIDIFRTSLSYISPSDKPTQQLSYDTPFNISHFYLSVLLFHATELESSPTIPLVYLIHQRNLSLTQDEFFSHVATTVPEIQKATNIVTDSETVYCTATSGWKWLCI